MFWCLFIAYLYPAGTQHENRLKSVDYEQCALFFFSQANASANEKYGEDLEKMKLNGPGKRKLGQGTIYGTD